MARILKIWYRKDRKAWFLEIRGNRHNWGPNKTTRRFCLDAIRQLISWAMQQ